MIMAITSYVRHKRRPVSFSHIDELLKNLFDYHNGPHYIRKARRLGIGDDVVGAKQIWEAIRRAPRESEEARRYEEVRVDMEKWYRKALRFCRHYNHSSDGRSNKIRLGAFSLERCSGSLKFVLMEPRRGERDV